MPGTSHDKDNCREALLTMKLRGSSGAKMGEIIYYIPLHMYHLVKSNGLSPFLLTLTLGGTNGVREG